MAYDITDFRKEVIEKSFEKPVLVDFWAEWCGPCKILGPVLERLAEKYRDKWVLAKVNTEQFPDLAMQYNIRGIPNVKLFVNGEIVDEFTGALPEPMIEQWLKKAIPGKHDKTLAEAKQLLSTGNSERAVPLLEAVLKAEPDNAEAKALLAKALIFSDPERSVALAQSLEGTEFYDLGVALQTLARLIKLAEHPEQLPDSPVKERYLQAIQHLKNQQFTAALDAFIGIVEDARDYEDDGARKACVAIFNYLGSDDETVRDYRAKLSRAMYV